MTDRASRVLQLVALTPAQFGVLKIIAQNFAVLGDANERWAYSCAGFEYADMSRYRIQQLVNLSMVEIRPVVGHRHEWNAWADRQAVVTSKGRECFEKHGAFLAAVRQPRPQRAVDLSVPMRAELLTRRALAVWSAHDQERA